MIFLKKKFFTNKIEIKIDFKLSFVFRFKELIFFLLILHSFLLIPLSLWPVSIEKLDIFYRLVIFIFTYLTKITKVEKSL